MRRIARIGLSLSMVVCVVLGYGYWHAKNHAALNISMYDITDPSAFASLKDTAVRLKNAQGKVLAFGKSDSIYGTVYLSHPESGSCYEAEHQATSSREALNTWQICFRQYATWIMEWVRTARFIDIRVGDCVIENIAITIREHPADWWTWWVPLPHVGGKPYTYFDLTMRVDPVACSVAN